MEESELMVSGRAAGKTGFKSKNHNTRLRMVNKEVEKLAI